MLVKLIMVQYKCSYPGEYAPNVADAWDEYTLEDNYTGFQEALKKHKAMEGNDYEDDGVKVLTVHIADAAIDKLFNPAAFTVVAEVQEDE